MDVLSPELEFLNELPIRPLNIADVKGCHPVALYLGNYSPCNMELPTDWPCHAAARSIEALRDLEIPDVIRRLSCIASGETSVHRRRKSALQDSTDA